jgi:uncharacterized protein YceH (UPF0502 family)
VCIFQIHHLANGGAVADLSRSRVAKYEHFMGMNVIGAYLTDVHLIGMYLIRAHLTGVHLVGVHPAGVFVTSYRNPSIPYHH